MLRSELRRAKQDGGGGDGGDRSGTRCTVCLDNPREVVFQECGHVCSCSDCAARYYVCSTLNRVHHPFEGKRIIAFFYYYNHC